MTTAADVLEEYGRAIRGAWGGIDGRSVMSCMEDIAADMRKYSNGPLPDGLVQCRRISFGICPHGNGHWDEYCEDYECEPEP